MIVLMGERSAGGGVRYWPKLRLTGRLNSLYRAGLSLITCGEGRAVADGIGLLW
jgi:hypothetical protein